MDNLNKAFAALRKLGYFAERNFTCCNTCAWAEIPEDKADKAIFIHEQGEDRLEEFGSTYCNWSGDGQEIVDVLLANGVQASWDGDKDRGIQITVY